MFGITTKKEHHMIRKLLVVGAALAMPVSVVAAGGVAGAKTVTPADPSQTLAISATVNFSLGLSSRGTATTEKDSNTTISDETLSGHDGNGHASTAAITSLVNVASKTTGCKVSVTSTSLGQQSKVDPPYGPVVFNSQSDANAASDVAAQETADANSIGVPAACITDKVKTSSKTGTTYTLEAAKENIAGSLAGFASTGASSLGKALKTIDITVTDGGLTDSPITYVLKTTSTQEVVGGCGGSSGDNSEVGFLASGSVSSPKADKGLSASLTACLGTVTQGTGGAQGQSFLAVLESGNPNEVIQGVQVDPVYSSLAIG
jgi:hypothetical protein